MMTALCVAPLCGAQEVGAPQPQVAGAVVSQAPATSDIAAALALMPQDAEAFVALGNLPGCLKLFGKTTEELGDDGKLQSAALVLGHGSSDALRQTLPIFSLLTSEEALENIAGSWATCAHHHAAEVIAKQLEQQDQEGTDQAIAAFSELRLAPIYGVVTTREGGCEMFEELQQELLESADSDPACETVEIGAWKGVHATFSEQEIAEMIEDSETLTPLQKAKMAEALRKVSLYVLCTVQDNAAVFVVCTDPAQAQLAATPADSLLATPKVAFMGQQVNPIFASYLPAPLCNTLSAINKAPLHSLIGFASGVFKTLGAESSAPAAYQGAAEALATLNTFIEVPEMDQPMTMMLWEDGDIHFSLDADARGCRFVPTPSVALPVTEQTIFTFECDPTVGGPQRDFSSLVTVCEKLAEGVAATLAEENQAQAQAMLTQYHVFDSEKALLGSSLTSWGEAFNGQSSVLIDASGAVPASLFGGSPVDTVPVPRLAVCAGLQDRSKLGVGSDAFMQALTQGMEKLNQDPAMLAQVPVSVTQSGAISMHMLALPVCCPGFSPTVAISDQTWSLSSSAELAKALAGGEVRPAAAEGKASFCFRTKPVADLLLSLASSDVSSPGMKNAAGVAQAVSSCVSSVCGTVTTTEDDVMHVRVDVNLQH